MNVSCNCIYVSAGCNRSPNTLDWGKNEIICYSACSVIHLWRYEKPHGFNHLQTLFGHKQLVTSVSWIRDNGKENELISTSADHTAAIWTLKENLFVKTSTLIGHASVVRNASGVYFPQCSRKSLLVATVSTDSALKLWKRCDKEEADCIQTISFGNGFGIDVKFACMHDTDEIMMLVGADDCKIHVYMQQELDQFVEVLSLDGHENWIRCLDIVKKDDRTLMVASASQDCYIRIWKIVPKATTPEVGECLKVDEAAFNTQSGSAYSVFLESVLSGHENWIYSVQWQFQKNANSGNLSLQLLSTSMDKTMIIWEADSSSNNIWTEKIRVGEVGGNTLGFLGGVFSPCGKVILAHGFQGALHIWKLNEELGEWEPGTTFGGHFSSVSDIDWDPDGNYLISCSSDQTTRIHASFVTSSGQNSWYEIARPQVHGYDMVCLAVLNRFKFVSAGDEKVIRVFQAPRSFAEALSNITKVDTSDYRNSELAEGASVPSLGLSNKAVFEDDLNRAHLPTENNHPKDRYPDFYYTPLHVTAPPTEETLIQNTLWPEIQKLYGHPYEVFTLATNHSGTLIASACKASKAEHAAIFLWDTSSGSRVGQLVFHNLTVTQLEFSPDDEYLLSVSRDRMWALYRHFPDESPPYRKVASLDKKNSVHTRIIWSCSWTFDSLYFATASRDKKVGVWEAANAESEAISSCSQPLEVEDSATALSFAPSLSNDRYILAVGLENGCIIISSWCKDNGFAIHQKLEENIAHHLTVNRLRFSPAMTSSDAERGVVRLASCSNDSHVKIYDVTFSVESIRR